ncbi:MAG: hypothetical protein ACI9XR_001912 [Flavobacterium sp.]|jgi:hypothetical protein
MSLTRSSWHQNDNKLNKKVAYKIILEAEIYNTLLAVSQTAI